MSVKVTISMEDRTKKMLTALARKHKRSISGLISEWVVKEGKKEKGLFFEKGLGTILRSPNEILEEDNDRNYKTLLGEILEEKYK